MKTMQKLIDAIKAHGTQDEQLNARGNTVWRVTHSTDRYIVDFCDDFKASGWLQFDTDQDASYFGVWVNPAQRLTLTYCEGDWTLVECPTAETYNAELADASQFYGEGFVAKVIDASTGHQTTFRQDRQEFFIPV